MINRFIRLTVNEDREQTLQIHKKQRQVDTLEGLRQKVGKDSVRQKHHHAQQLLHPTKVLNPFSEQLTFTADYLRNRRDHQKYLGLIKTITFLHQYQRPHQETELDGEMLEYIEVDLKDIEMANHLMTEILGRCLDELAPQTRRLLGLILKMVQERCETKAIEMNEVHFTRRQVREYTRWSDNQLKVHMKRLEELEYLLTLQGGRGSNYIYELLWLGEGDDGSKFLPGLINPKEIKPQKLGVAV